MKFEVEILDTDLNDKNLIMEAVRLVSDLTLQISETGRKSLVNELIEINEAIDQLKSKWFIHQEEKIKSKLLEFFGEDLVEGTNSYEAV